MHRFFFQLFAAVLLFVGSSCRPGDEQPHQRLTVFAAASLTDVLKEVGRSFRDATGIAVDFNFAGSGTLARQILATDQGDGFLSANLFWMEEVVDAGKTLTNSSRSVLLNQLAVIARKDSDFAWESPEELANLPFRFLVIGDPASVPVGRYARDWLQSVNLSNGSTLWEAVEGRTSPTTDTRAALSQVAADRSLLGIVYVTDALTRPETVRVLYKVPIPQSPRIEYAAAVLRSTANPEAAQLFLDFLTGPEAGVIFENAGFRPIGGDPSGSGVSESPVPADPYPPE